MARYTGPKTKVSRRYRVPLFGSSKALERKNYPPGMHGPRGARRKQSDYAIALGEKQKRAAQDDPGRPPRVYAPASARVVKEPLPWDAEILTSGRSHTITAEAALHPGDRSDPAERG